MTVEMQISAGTRLYTVVEDLTSFFQLVLAGRVTDALDGEPLRFLFQVAASRPDLSVKVLGDGLFAVAADPDLVFPLLATEPYDFELEVTVPGYRQTTVAVPVPAASTFPLGELEVPLGRLPVRLQGRVVQTAGGAAIAGARVTIEAPEVLALHTPLAFPHPAGMEVRECALAPVGPVRQLAAAADGGDDTVTVSSRTGLAPGDILRLGPAHRLDFGVIAVLAPEPADLAQPGEVTLRAPLARSLPAGAEVQTVNPVPGPAVAHLDQPTAAGEGVVVLDGPLTANAVRVEPAASPEVEYHALGAVTDSEGYYRLDGIAGVAEATFLASAPGFVDHERPWVIDASSRINLLDFRLENP